MTNKEKLLSFTTYLKDRGHPWSSRQIIEPHPSNGRYLVNVRVTYQMQRGADGEWVEMSVEQSSIQENRYDGIFDTDGMLLHCLMLAFGQDPTIDD